MDGPGKEQVIVVSDVHLGSEGADSAEFSRFLRWLSSLPRQGHHVDAGGGEGPDGPCATVFPPTTLVLLGDILELWDPRDQNPNHVIVDAIEPLSCMHGIACTIVYVIGNHDEDILDLAATLEGPFSWGPDTAPSGSLEGCGGGGVQKGPREEARATSFVIGNESYPKTELRSFTTRGGETVTYRVLAGVPVGDTRYGFIHGHQFDKEQIQYLVSKVYNKRFDPVDTLNDLSHVTMTSEMQAQGRMITVAWICSILLASGFLPLVITSVLSIVLFMVPFVILASKNRDAWQVIRDYRVTGWRKAVIRWLFLWSLPTVLLLFVIAGLTDILVPLTTRFLPVLELVVLTVLFIMIPFVQFLAGAKRSAYEYFIRNTDKSAEKVLEKGFSPEADFFDCQVVVFGHTHQAGWCLVPKERRNPDIKDKRPLLFINAGCWTTGRETTLINTFVSINPEGVSLLQWMGGGDVRCVAHFPHDTLVSLGVIPGAPPGDKSPD